MGLKYKFDEQEKKGDDPAADAAQDIEWYQEPGTT
jgi:hypothetical protein